MKQTPAQVFLFSAHSFILTRPNKLLATLMILAVFLSSPLSGEAGEHLPVFPSIEANVRFWENVYSRYTTKQGILHDKDNLNIVYTVIDLVDWDTSGSAQINKRLIKLARQHYKRVLADLASGKKPATDDEKRIAAMFTRNSHQGFKKARDNIRLQIGQKDRFLKGIIRSGAYMSAIKKIFSTYKLPPELGYLPHVESSFNPEAYSKAGAAGLWQFTRSTGRQYMRVDNIVDQRYDPYFATQAAALFLKENYDLLESWPLAITAYNHGRSGMLRAAKKFGGYEQIFNKHETARFRFASRNFYSEFIAATNVARKLENDKSIILDRPEATIMVRTGGFILAQDIRSHFRLSEEDFTRLNPALRKPVLTGEKFIPKNYYVRIPANARTRDLASTIPSSLYHHSQIRDKEYIVRRGDTVGAIARKYKISTAELVMANNLNRRGMIRMGQKLKIPTKANGKNSGQVIILESSSKNKPD